MALSEICAQLSAAVGETEDVEALQIALGAINDISVEIQAKIKKAGTKPAVARCPKKEAQLKKTFTELNKSGNGMLDFQEFLQLLRRGDPNYKEEQAHLVFNGVDLESRGMINFDEFVDYVYDHQDHDKFIQAEPKNHREEEAKEQVMGKSAELRKQAVAVVNGDGRNWSELSWQDRLEEIHEIETQLPKAATEGEALAEAAAAAPAAAEGEKKGNHITDMNQEELVNYSITSDDLTFARNFEGAAEDLQAFKERLISAPSPVEALDIPKYIAKGTAGWVFVAERKDTGARQAMKMIRMTQVRSGLREWYISKLCRQLEIDNIVGTCDDVYVMPKASAPPVVAEQISNAGPVPYYVCLIQEFMGGGSLEDLVEKDLMTPALLLQALETLASTLAKMHESRIQHRDVKPENALIEMVDGELKAVKLCDFGSAELGDNKEGKADDVRRFGITIFALATGESWTKNRLLKAKPEELIARMKKAVAKESGAMSKLPGILTEILTKNPTMDKVAGMMTDLRNSL